MEENRLLFKTTSQKAASHGPSVSRQGQSQARLGQMEAGAPLRLLRESDTACSFKVKN